MTPQHRGGTAPWGTRFVLSLVLLAAAGGLGYIGVDTIRQERFVEDLETRWGSSLRFRPTNTKIDLGSTVSRRTRVLTGAEAVVRGAGILALGVMAGVGCLCLAWTLLGPLGPSPTWGRPHTVLNLASFAGLLAAIACLCPPWRVAFSVDAAVFYAALGVGLLLTVMSEAWQRRCGLVVGVVGIAAFALVLICREGLAGLVLG
jgi:hypothetical protein